MERIHHRETFQTSIDLINQLDGVCPSSDRRTIINSMKIASSTPFRWLVAGLNFMKKIGDKEKILTLIYTTQIWIPVRNRLLIDYSKVEDRIIHNGSVGNDVVHRKSLKAYEKGANHINQLSERNARICLPEIIPIAKYYFTLSSLMHTINLINDILLLWPNIDKSSVNRGNNISLGLNDGTPSAILCHTPRFITHRVLGLKYMIYIGLVFSGLILIWRITIKLTNQFSLDAAIYLLINDQTVTKNLKTPQEAIRFYRQYGMLDLVGRILFFKMEDKVHDRIELRLRPNRTPEARTKLQLLLRGGFFRASVIILISAVLLFPSALYAMLYNLDEFYIGCELTWFNFAHLNRFMGSALLSLIMFMDCVVCMLYALLFGMLLVKDLKIYWFHIEIEMSKLARIIPRYRQLHDSYIRPEIILNSLEQTTQRCYHETMDWGIQFNYDDGSRSPGEINTNYFFNSNHAIARATKEGKQRQRKQQGGGLNRKLMRATTNYASTNCTNQLLCADDSSLVRQIFLFQSSVCDFFEQLQKTDQLVSVAMGHMFTIWVSLNAVISFTGLQSNTSSAVVLVRAFQLFILTIFCLISSRILTLRSSTEPAYKIISSLMAKDPSLEKRRWLALLKYYTGMQRNAFTIYRSEPFTLNIFLKSFTYTITFALYVYSLSFR